MAKKASIRNVKRKAKALPANRQAVEVNTFTPKIEKPDNSAEDVAALTTEELDEEEREFRELRRDLPGVKGASSAGIISIGVAKIPGQNEFFRTLKGFSPVIPIVNIEVGMEKQYFAVTDPMIAELSAIGITVSDHRLYFTVTARGAFKVVPVRQAGSNGEQDEYSRTKEIGLIAGMDQWVRLYTDLENRCYRAFPAPAERFAAAVFPDLKPAKIIRLCFRDKGRLLDGINHPLYLKWAARDRD